jgi:predicted enzyme related to lactoylglutathione lyase
MEPLFRKVDCLRVAVPDIDAALAFYRDALGHDLVWRTTTAAGLRTRDGDAEIVVHTDGHGTETDLTVDAVPDAVRAIVAAGGSVVAEPFEIQIGLCAVVRDPWGNTLVILDASKGLLRTDAEGYVIGNDAPL